MAKENIRNLTKNELSNKLEDYIDELRKLKFERVIGSVANNKRYKTVRHMIARIKTVLHEYKLGIRK